MGENNKGTDRKEFTYTNHSKWKTQLDTPCCLLMPCTKCNEILFVGDFYKVKKGRIDVLGNKRVSICKKCSNKKYVDIPDQRRKLLYGARQRANLNGWEFNIEIDDIIIPEFCPILGIRLVPATGKGSRVGATNDLAPSIDRIDSSKGYIKGNICVISKRANFLKRHANYKELLAVYTYMMAIKDQGRDSEPSTPYINNPIVTKEVLDICAKQRIAEWSK